jgi:hypothetical protein
VRFIQMSLVFVVGFFAALSIRVAVDVFEHPGDRTVQRIYAGFDRQFGGDDARWKVQSQGKLVCEHPGSILISNCAYVTMRLSLWPFRWQFAHQFRPEILYQLAH